MIDKQALIERVDLLSLIGHDTALGSRPVAATQGGEWAGACPFCGGVDRFRVQPNHPGGGRWMCRQCGEGRWHNAIDYVIRRDGLDFKTACALLSGGELPTTQQRREPEPSPAYDAPAGDWQAQALRAVEICASSLWGQTGQRALEYLRGRGLNDDTTRHFRLGYSPGAKFGELWIPRGVVIPCQASGEVWYLKVALMPGDPVRCERCREQTPARQPCPRCGTANKYRGVRGNRTAAIFNADDLVGAELALFVEGEIDAMTAWQRLRDVIAICTLGSATNRLDLAAWGAYLLPLRYALVVYDQDAAGEAGGRSWADLSERVRLCQLPEGVKDINDFTQAGGQLWPWLRGELDRLGVLAGLGVFDASSQHITPTAYDDYAPGKQSGVARAELQAAHERDHGEV
jgi:DNA primase